MDRRGRFLTVTVLAALAMTVAGVSLAWACTGPGFGTPSSPPPPGAEPAGDQDQAPMAAPPGSSAANSTSGAEERAVDPAVRRADPAPGARSARPDEPATGRRAIRARESGATAGVTNRGGRPVFTSSTPPKDKPPRGAKGSRAGGASVSERTAAGDPWSGFASAPAPRGAEARAVAPAQRQAGTAVGMLILGLGLVGAFGTALVAAAPRRRRKAASTPADGETPPVGR